MFCEARYFLKHKYEIFELQVKSGIHTQILTAYYEEELPWEGKAEKRQEQHN